VEEDTLVGREIAGYSLEEIIGRGGMGVVYRAEHLRLGRKVALKVVAPQIAREPKFRERFLRESRTAGALDHPNVVPIYDAGEADGVLYIAMRFVDGVDLATLIEREGPLDPARTARIVAQVASALDAAADAGLVHRDVKPSNVLLPARGAGRGEHAYLGDFGLTKRVLSESGVTGSSAFLGTIAYVAPEQIEGRQIDSRADEYSLACLTFECLTGHRPFERETDIATLYAHIRDPFPTVAETVPSAELAQAIDAVLAKGGAKQPADRYPTAGDMADDLQRVTGASTAGSGPLPPISTSTRRLRPRTLGAVAVLAILAVAAVGFLLLRGLGPPAPLLTGHGVVAIEATTNAASAAAALDDEPTAIAADETAAWVAHFSTGTVSRIDAAAPHAVTEITVGSGPQAIVAGAGHVWVSNTTAETLSEIDIEQPDRAATNLILLFRPGGLAFGGDALWVINTQLDAIVQVATDRLAIVPPPITVGAGPIAVAAGGSAVWVSNGLDESLSRVQVGLTAAAAPIPLDFAPGAIAIDLETEAVWVVDSAGDALVRFDLGSRQEVARVEVGARPVAVAVGAGAVWVASSASGDVSRIDPATNTVTATIPIGGSPQGIAVGGTTVWVAVAEP
jgi:YVTN family beta-propeller protein